MKRNLLKLFALTCAMLVNASAWAQSSTLAIDPFTIEKGATKQVAIKLVKEAGTEVIGFQCNVELPAGLTITKDEEEELNVNPVSGTVKSSKANIILNYSETTGVLLVYNDRNSAYKDDVEGVVLFEFKASDDFAGGVIALKNIVLSLTGNQKVTAADVTAEVSVPAVVPVPEGPSLYIKDFTIAAGETKNVQIELVKGEDPIIGFQCKIALPDGLTITLDEDQEPNVVSVPGTVTSSKANVIVNYSATSGTLLVYNDKNSPYKEDATGVVELELKAADTFEAGFITISEIVFSKQGNQKETASDTKTKVNNPDGIADMKAATSSDIYTISGTRVRTMTRGLYIVNGKKVVVK